MRTSYRRTLAAVALAGSPLRVRASAAEGRAVRLGAAAGALLLLTLLAGQDGWAQRYDPVPSPAQGTLLPGKHCLDENATKLQLNHYMAGSINPLGLENQMRLSLCKPLIQKPGLLFELTNVEFGMVNFISPTHIHAGGYVFVTPLSFLVLRAELTGFFIWPLPLQGAGVITVNNYSDFKLETLQPAVGEAKSGYGLRSLVGATLQGALPLGRRLRLLLVDNFGGEYWRLNRESFFYAARRDAILFGGGDWAVANTAVLLLQISITQNHLMRVGLIDDLVYVPGANYLGHIAAGLIAYQVKNLRNLARNFSIFVRAGAFTHHAFRVGAGPTIGAGLDITYELSKRPTPRPDPPAEPVPPADRPAVPHPSSSPLSPGEGP